MKIGVSRAFPLGFSFVVEKDKDYEKVDDIIEACLRLEQALIIGEGEEEKEEE